MPEDHKGSYMRIRDSAQVSDEQKVGLNNLQPATQDYLRKRGQQAIFEELLWYNSGDVYILKMIVAGKTIRIEISEADLEDSAYRCERNGDMPIA